MSALVEGWRQIVGMGESEEVVVEKDHAETTQTVPSVDITKQLETLQERLITLKSSLGALKERLSGLSNKLVGLRGKLESLRGAVSPES